jgi:hypothetical protein
MELAAQLAEAHATIDTLQTSKLALFNQVSLLEAELVTSVTPRRTLTDSERDFGNRLNHYPHFTSFLFPISSRILSQSLIYNLPLLLPYLHSVTVAPATELLPSINT